LAQEQRWLQEVVAFRDRQGQLAHQGEGEAEEQLGGRAALQLGGAGGRRRRVLFCHQGA